MINKDELIFAVDENNHPIKPISRQEAHEKGIWHRISHVWIINKKKQILCQKRSILKDNNPGKWEACFGGHLAANEEYIDNAIKELYEEIGVLLDKNELHFFSINKNYNTKHFQGVFYVTWRGNIKQMKLEKEEVDEIKWFDISKLSDILLENKNQEWVHLDYQDKMLEYLMKLA